MKFLKNILSIVALFAIGSVDARTTAGGGTARPSAQSIFTQANKDIEKIQEVQEKPKEGPKKSVEALKQLMTQVINAKTSSVWNSKTNLLQDTFVNSMVDACKKNSMDARQLGMLLRTAIYKHADFSGEKETDSTRLTNLNEQIKDAEKKLIS